MWRDSITSGWNFWGIEFWGSRRANIYFHFFRSGTRASSRKAWLGWSAPLRSTPPRVAWGSAITCGSDPARKRQAGGQRDGYWLTLTKQLPAQFIWMEGCSSRNLSCAGLCWSRRWKAELKAWSARIISQRCRSFCNSGALRQRLTAFTTHRDRNITNYLKSRCGIRGASSPDPKRTAKKKRSKPRQNWRWLF